MRNLIKQLEEAKGAAAGSLKDRLDAATQGLLADVVAEMKRRKSFQATLGKMEIQIAIPVPEGKGAPLRMQMAPYEFEYDPMGQHGGFSFVTRIEDPRVEEYYGDEHPFRFSVTAAELATWIEGCGNDALIEFNR